MGEPLVREVSEDALLARIVPLLPPGRATLLPSGDDAAVVAAADGRFVVTTDVLVEGRHFRRAWSTGRDVGRRAAVQNLADVAAMGAVPTALVVALGLPGDLPVAWLEDLARGLADECGPLGVGVVGGDLSGGSEVTVAVTALGDLEGRAPVTRSGARPGDVVAHAGVRGRSAAGFALLAADLETLDDELVAAYRHPTSPVAAGPVAARAGATAMIDVSDGLLRDAGRLAAASHVLIDLDADAFAADRGRLAAVAEVLGEDPTAWVLGGGEDHGLLATFPASALVPGPFVVVGRVLAAPADGAPEVLVGGARPSVPAGWDHFAG
ncbi:MAG: thiamine-phosphate kinase [Cellulomonas sp. 73-92]|uniref:thiamine-phosphate kinase n=1 Tax=Cellulomonas sp. 73-92 TaxID=1895740 RepID=UPI0009292B9F|nr:thiamine-phosphate kinase [Cellulomonas sp. 73-92]OJV75016.1 MAG: thiamine-phosphate kinase [Cellulomonas sp. 73-92]